MPVLTLKNKMFCQELVRCGDKKEAALLAGYAEGSAQQQAQEMLNKPHIKKYMDELNRRRLARTEIDGDALLKQLQEMRLADYADILNPENGEYLPVGDWPPIWRQMISSVDIVEIFEGKGEDRQHVGNVHKIKFIPRDKIMKMFGDHVKVQGFQKTEVHVHAHLHESAARIRQGRERSREIEVNRQPVITGQTIPLENLPDSENSNSLEDRVRGARDSERYHTRGDGR